MLLKLRWIIAFPLMESHRSNPHFELELFWLWLRWHRPTASGFKRFSNVQWNGLVIAESQEPRVLPSSGCRSHTLRHVHAPYVHLSFAQATDGYLAANHWKALFGPRPRPRRQIGVGAVDEQKPSSDHLQINPNQSKSKPKVFPI